jgi:DNA-binding transcriptional LysR family regulator
LQLRDLVGEPWLMPPAESLIGAFTAEAFRTSGLKPPHGRVITFSVPLCYQLLSRGSFLAMLPVSMARLGKNLPLKILNVGFFAISRPTGIITLKKRTLSPLAQLFINKVREFAEPLAKDQSLAPESQHGLRRSGKGV